MVTNTENGIEELYAASESLSKYRPNYPDGFPISTPTTPGATSFSEFTSQFAVPKLSASNFKDCGTAEVPSGGSALNNFISDFGKNESAICTGESIADDCIDTMATIFDGYTYQTFYVVKRDDGVCSVGGFDNVVDYKYISLCSVEGVMNAYFNKNDSFSEWRNVFSEKPGETIASLYQVVIGGVYQYLDTEKWDCKSFEL